MHKVESATEKRKLPVINSESYLFSAWEGSNGQPKKYSDGLLHYEERGQF